MTTCSGFTTTTITTATSRFQKRASKTITSSSSSLHVAPVETIQELWTSYNNALETNPLLVKSITAGVILGAADFAGQTLQNSSLEEKKDIDLGRIARFAIFGLVLQAPWNHFYYQFLDSAIPPTPEPWTSTTAIKTVIDQFVQAPIFTVLIFAFLGFLEGKNTEAIQKQLEDDYKDTMLANCKNHTFLFLYR
jgi:hypothetical protein